MCCSTCCSVLLEAAAASSALPAAATLALTGRRSAAFQRMALWPAYHVDAVECGRANADIDQRTVVRGRSVRPATLTVSMYRLRSSVPAAPSFGKTMSTRWLGTVFSPKL